MTLAEEGLIRTLCFFDVLGYAPTWIEWLSYWDGGGEPHSKMSLFEAEQGARGLCASGRVSQQRGRVTFAGREGLIAEHEQREAFFPRKLRRARKVVAWLRRLGGVRFVAVCNTTALAQAKDESDLDFFIITRAGSLWQTRALSALPFKVLDQRPRPGQLIEDAVCLSFFIDETVLDLSSLMLPQDSYFRYWFLSLLPLYDDGISKALWAANASLVQRHPSACPWVRHLTAGFETPSLRLPAISGLESLARHIQESRLSSEIHQLANRDTRVVINDHILKFHVDDTRERYQSEYAAACTREHISS